MPPMSCPLFYILSTIGMKQLLLILSVFAFSVSCFGQEVQEVTENFMDHISKKDANATVVINQDARLESIVNGDYYEAAAPTGPRTYTVKKVVQKQKLKGYRIQVYWGGSQQSEKAKAQMAGYKVSAIFPGLQVYTTFEAPHWRCRVGDFATIQEANAYLAKIKAAKIANNPIVVNSVIYGYK